MCLEAVTPGVCKGRLKEGGEDWVSGILDLCAEGGMGAMVVGAAPFPFPPTPR